MTMMSTGVVLAVGFQLSGIPHFKCSEETVNNKCLIIIVNVDMNSVS